MWRAFTRDGQHLFEGKHGRPVELGNNNGLIAIAEEEHHHNVMVLLDHGIIVLEYEGWEWAENTEKPRLIVKTSERTIFLYICEETLIGADVRHLISTKPDKKGWFSQKEEPVVWRPIWFTRQYPMQGISVRVIGAQTTFPEQHGGMNVKKMVMLYPDGRIGIS